MNYPNELRYWGAAEDVAKACGVSKQTVYLWKSKNIVPPRVAKEVRRLAKRKRDLLKTAAESAPAPTPEPEPQPETLKLKLSDIAQTIADYLKQEGM